MLPTNFEPSPNSQPELQTVILRIRDWAREHQDWSLLDPRVLSHDLRVDPFLLSVALQQIVDTGPYRVVYMVLTPDGVFADREFDDPLQVPKRMADATNRDFNTEEGEILPVLKPKRVGWASYSI